MNTRTVLIVRTFCFTEKAFELLKKLELLLPEIEWVALKKEEILYEWTEDAFKKSLPLLFISAAGIAVRTISPFVKDKMTDSPVVVMDENAKFIIPVLSGHLGNANEIATMISNAIGAQTVITTATDVNEKFSIDVFAKNNGFRIMNRNGIKKISAKILSGKKIKVYIDEKIEIKDKSIPDEIILCNEKTADDFDVVITTNENLCFQNLNVLFLVQKKYCVGIGCKKGKTFDELIYFAEKVFKEKLNERLLFSVYSISSIDLKNKENGLMEFAHYLHVPFVTFSSEELKKAQGDFSKSIFVEKITGVSNVCERSAVLAAGMNCKLKVKKESFDGMTISVAEKKAEIIFWK